jgi:microcompartment protein CcmK/EutM
MKLARVKGNVVATIKHPGLQGRKMMIVQPIDPWGKDLGDELVVIDTVQSGVGDRVLLLDEGGSARQIIHYNNAPIRCVIVGIVDHVEITEPAPSV